jgi:hypothetical protein
MILAGLCIRGQEYSGAKPLLQQNQIEIFRPRTSTAICEIQYTGLKQPTQFPEELKHGI